MEISTFSPGYSAFMHFSAHSVGGGWFFWAVGGGHWEAGVTKNFAGLVEL